jgi:hypothetical protein
MAAMNQTTLPWVGLTVAAVAVVVVTFAMNTPAPNFSLLAILVLVGLVTVTGFVSVLSVTASRLGILDGRHPFGLPEGSIRAILTLAFIVLVGVFASYLLVQTSRTSIVMPKEPLLLAATTLAEAKALQTQLSAEGLVVISGTTDPIRATFFPRNDFRLADDVAKQILTMLSTMLAAMIGFYFGARPSEAPVDPHVAERLTAAADLGALALTAPTYDTVKKAADEKGDTNLSEEQKAALLAIRKRVALVGEKVQAAMDAAKDAKTPIETLRAAKAAALEAHATLQAEFDELAKLP